MKGKWYCTECEWSGWFPHMTNISKRSKGIEVMSTLHSCPGLNTRGNVCGAKVNYVAD